MRRILVVDDSAVLRSIVRTYLTGLGFEVDFAESGAEAIETFRQHEPALVITDYNMEGMNGVDLARRLRSLAGSRALHVVLITSSKDLDKAELIRSGAIDAFLHKPLQREELCSIVTTLLPPVETAVTSSRRRLRVLVADDSGVGRTILSRILGADAGINIVGQAEDGEQALAMAIKERPHVCLLDARLSKLDGVALTKRIMAEAPTRIVLMTDDQSPRTGALAFAATQVGAIETLARPAWSDPSGEQATAFRDTVRLLADVSLSIPPPPSPRRTIAPLSRRATHRPPALVGVCASTGGPGALATLLPLLAPTVDAAPIIVVQHGPPGFAEALVDWLRTETKLPVRLARDREALRPGLVLVAPDDRHVVLSSRTHLELVEDPPLRGRRPSATRLFESMGKHLGDTAIGVILTGMGDDGAEGLASLVAAGGSAFAQSPESCVVGSMPAAALARGIATSLSVQAIAADIVGRSSVGSRP